MPFQQPSFSLQKADIANILATREYLSEFSYTISILIPTPIVYESYKLLFDNEVLLSRLNDNNDKELLLADDSGLNP